MSLRRITPIPTLLAVAVIAACQAGDTSRDTSADGAPADAQAGRGSDVGVVDVVARDFAFEAPDSIPSGWTSFRFTNHGAQTHFFVLDHLPDGKTLDDFVAAVAEPFDSAWTGLKNGTLDKAGVGPLLGRMLPGWFANVEQTGGVGLVAPGHSGRATVRLEPGTYIMECYAKTPDGVFHTALGMARQLTVTSARSVTGPPTADLEITFADGGMTAPSRVTPGRHTIAVHYRQAADGLLANDVHVAKLPDGVAAEAVVPWMDWMNVEGLQAPAPATFLGGVQEVPVGGTAYFTVELSPGRHAWISENAENGMLKSFTVAAATSADRGLD